MANILLNLLCLLGIIVVCLLIVGVVFFAILLIGKLAQLLKDDKGNRGGEK